METEHIKEFLVMAEKLNYTAASDELFISQSSLFKHIRALEEELGVAFFAKEGKRVVMTEFGKMFVNHAEVILQQIEAYKEEAESRREDQENTLFLIEANPNPELGIAFRKEYPQFKLDPEFKSAIAEAYESDAELIISHGRVPLFEDKYDCVELASDSIVVVVPNDHPFAEKESIRLIDLKNEDFIGFSVNNPHNNRPADNKFDVASICRGAGFEANIVVSAFPGSEIARLVSQGGGISLLLKEATRRRMGDQVSYIDLDPELKFPMMAYYRKDKALSKAAQAYISFAKEWFQSHN